MKKLLLALLLTSMSAFAAPVKITLQVVCDDANTLFQNLVEGEYQEIPYWGGFEDLEKTSFVLLTNKETGSWTMIRYNSKRACVLAVGDRWIPAPPNPLGPTL